MKALGAEVVGISTDGDVKTQCAFAESVGVQFPMLVDPGGAIARRYDVLWPFITVSKRVTFLIDEAQLVRGIFWHEGRLSAHRDGVLVALQRMKAQRDAA